MLVMPLLCKNPFKYVGLPTGQNALKSNYFCQLDLTKFIKFLENRVSYLIFPLMENGVNRFSEKQHPEFDEAIDKPGLIERARQAIKMALAGTVIIAGTAGAALADDTKPIEVAASEEIELDLDLDELLEEAKESTAEATKKAELAKQRAAAAEDIANQIEEAVTN